MDSKRENTIKERAKLVNYNSEKYQLVHATSAIEILLEDICKQHFDAKINELKEKIKNTNDGIKMDGYRKEVDELLTVLRDNRLNINIEYIDNMDEFGARTYRSGNKLHIALPASLGRQIRDKDENINYSTIAKLRKLMAHELGHITLHTNEILNYSGLDGTNSFTDNELEIEANLFAKILLSERKDRNIRFYADGGYNKI